LVKAAKAEVLARVASYKMKAPIIASKPNPKPIVPSAKVPTEYLTFIRVKSTKLCLSVQDNKGAAYTFAPCNFKDKSQKFRFIPNGNAYYIRTHDGTFAMDLNDRVRQWEGTKFTNKFGNNSVNQQFTITNVGGNYFTFVQKTSQFCLSTQYNTDCTVLKCYNNDDAQMFTLEPDTSAQF
jgi:hypothetical protein